MAGSAVAASRPLCYSLDTTGPLTWTVEDAALSLQVLAGHDPRDPGSADVPVPDYTAALRDGVKGLRIGYCRAFNADGEVGAEQAAALDQAAQTLATLGAEVSEVALPPNAQFQACARTISHSESFAIHRKDLQQRPELYARVTRERLMLGAFVTRPAIRPSAAAAPHPDPQGRCPVRALRRAADRGHSRARRRCSKRPMTAPGGASNRWPRYST